MKSEDKKISNKELMLYIKALDFKLDSIKEKENFYKEKYNEEKDNKWFKCLSNSSTEYYTYKNKRNLAIDKILSDDFIKNLDKYQEEPKILNNEELMLYIEAINYKLKDLEELEIFYKEQYDKEKDDKKFINWSNTRAEHSEYKKKREIIDDIILSDEFIKNIDKDEEKSIKKNLSILKRKR